MNYSTKFNIFRCNTSVVITCKREDGENCLVSCMLPCYVWYNRYLNNNRKGLFLWDYVLTIDTHTAGCVVWWGIHVTRRHFFSFLSTSLAFSYAYVWKCVAWHLNFSRNTENTSVWADTVVTRSKFHIEDLRIVGVPPT